MYIESTKHINTFFGNLEEHYEVQFVKFFDRHSLVPIKFSSFPSLIVINLHIFNLIRTNSSDLLTLNIDIRYTYATHGQTYYKLS